MANKTIDFTQSASSGSYIVGKIEVSSTADSANNTSDVVANLYVRKDSTDMTLTIPTQGTWSYSLTVNGSTISSTVSEDVLTSWVLIATKTVNDINHNPDGTKNIAVSGSITAPSGTSLAGHKTSGSGTMGLDTIPRASTITSASDTTLGKACSVKWTPASSSFRYKLKFSLGDWSYTTGAIHPNTTVAYTYTGYTVPLYVAEQITSSTSGTMKVTLYTYSDSSATSQVGSADSESFKVTVPNNSSTKPTVTMTIAPTNSPISGLYIQGKSKVKATLSAKGQYDASISSYKLYVGSTAYGSPYISDYLSTSGSVTVKGRAYDSRGYYGDAEQKITVIPYSKPKILPYDGESAIICARCDSSGNLTESGTYLKIKAKRSFSKVEADGVQKNFCAIRYRWRTENNTSFSSWVTILDKATTSDTIDTKLSGVVSSAQVAYVVQVGVVDDIGESASVQFEIPTEFVTIDIPENLKGKRIGIGRYAESSSDGGVDFGIPIHGGMVDNLTLGENLVATAAAPIDLNNIKTAGNYYSPSADNSQYITNTPYTDGGFSLTVREMQSTKMIRQEMFYGRTNWQRHYSSSTDTWSDWLRYLMTTYDTSTAVDFVTEIGVHNIDTNSYWRYRKWRSGAVDMNGVFNVTPELDSTFSSIVRYSKQIQIPLPFKVESFNFTGTPATNYFLITNAAVVTDSDGNNKVAFRLLRFIDFAGDPTSVRIIASGKYK